MDMDSDEQSVPLILARDVKEFTIECWDTNLMDWATEWDDTNSIRRWCASRSRSTAASAETRRHLRRRPRSPSSAKSPCRPKLCRASCKLAGRATTTTTTILPYIFQYLLPLRSEIEMKFHPRKNNSRSGIALIVVMIAIAVFPFWRRRSRSR